MRVLVFNAGSSSLKFKLLKPEEGMVEAQGVVESVRTEHARMTFTDVRGTLETGVVAPTLTSALDLVLERLVGPDAPLSSLAEVDAVGHRIAHGGELFSCSVVIDDDVIDAIEEHAHLAPLHNPPALAVIRRCQQLFGSVLEVASFDTAFHQTMPKKAYIYGLPYEYYEKYKVRRYGFHGTSHDFVSQRAAEIL
ncbi:MAG: acetate kinase, partial [Coriobacteriia bacterium]|nr:acetate kinase [Coriobacteriia bacterium]